MRTENPAWSEADSATGNRRGEAARSEPASRSASESEPASSRKVRTANLSEMRKPDIRREEILTSSGGILRGRSGRRAGKVGLGRLGDPGHRHRELVRYADDFVFLARRADKDLVSFIENKRENWLGLKINREKTRVANLREAGATLDFHGYSFRLDKDQHGREQCYWNMHPSKKALAREHEKQREIIHWRRSRQDHTLTSCPGRLSAFSGTSSPRLNSAGRRCQPIRV
jgi:hypothetical protein